MNSTNLTAPKSPMAAEKQKKRRDPSLDIIRSIAFFLVVLVHSFTHTGYYTNTVAGEKMFILTLFRNTAMMCVPLFILLSGYLLCRKVLCKKYYLGIIRILAVYVISSICCMLYMMIFRDVVYTPATFVYAILDFTGAEYAWYVEMYIGLFLLVPFLNLVYNGLTSKKHKLILVGSLLFITSVPAVLNTFDLSNLGILASASAQQKLIPGWWAGLYPLTYYFAGCYLREYGIGIKLRYRIPLFFASLTAVGTYSFCRSFGGVFQWHAYARYESLLIFIPAVLLFSIIKDLDHSKIPPAVTAVFSWISELSFGAYLLSFIFDDLYYGILKTHVPLFWDRAVYIPVMVLAVCISALVLSFGVNSLYGIINRIALSLKKPANTP